MAEPTEIAIRIDGTKAEVERISALIERAQQGDGAVVPELRKVLDQQPHLWRAAGDLARVTESAWVQRTAGDNLLFRESIARRVRELRRELQGEAPSPLVRLLVDRVVCTWIGLQYCEAVHARRMLEQTFDQGEYYQRRLVRYQRMHLQAVRSLATLRRLEQRGPLVAVGLAQVNVSAPAPGVPPVVPGGAPIRADPVRADSLPYPAPAGTS